MLIVLRHATTEWNKPPKRCQGHLDVPLSDEGREAARALGPALPRFDAAYASHLSRARETAELLLGGAETPLSIDPRLAEAHCGDWQGELLGDLKRRFPEAWAVMVSDATHFAFPGGETYAAVLERFEAAIGELDARHAGGAALVVTHGGPIRLYLRRRGALVPAAAGGAPANLRGFRLEHGVVEIDR